MVAGRFISAFTVVFVLAASNGWCDFHLDPSAPLADKFDDTQNCTDLRLDSPTTSKAKPGGTMTGYPASQQWDSQMCESFAMAGYMDAYRRRTELLSNPASKADWGGDITSPAGILACSDSGVQHLNELGTDAPASYPDIINGIKKMGGTCNARKLYKSDAEFVKLLMDNRSHAKDTLFGSLGKAYGSVSDATGTAARDKAVKAWSRSVVCNLQRYDIPVPNVEDKVKEISEILSKATSNDPVSKLSFVCEVMKQTCKDLGAMNTYSPIPTMTSISANDPKSLQVVDKQLLRGLPVPFGIEKSFLMGGTPQNSGHAMLIVGRKWVDGKCRYLVHDSNGTDACENVYKNEEIIQHCGNKPAGNAAGPGNFWIDETSMNKGASGYQYAKD